MRKFFVAFIAICIFMLNLSVCFATEDTKIEISFAVGENVIKINGIDTLVETTPYVVDGVTLVPVRVITEAFGATVDWEGDTQKITLNYQDVTIIFHIEDSFAYVNSQKQELLYAPQLTKSVTMVPLRFITENFGADVNFNDNTQEITIVKTVGSQEPVSNIADILKKSDKNIVGDSYLNWSMQRTAEMELVFRSFDGRRNNFSFGTDISLFVGVYNNSEDDSLAQIKAKEMEDARRYTFIGQSVLKTGRGVEYVRTQYKDTDSFIDRRIYPYKEHIFVVNMILDNNVKDTERAKYAQIAESFDFQFVKTDTEDLSEIEDGMRLFSQKDFNISLRLPADWMDFSNENTLNKFYFSGYDKNDIFVGSVSLGIFSKEEDFTVQYWANRDLTRNSKQTNSELYQYSEVKEMQLGTQAASYYTCDRKTKDGSYIGNDIFWSYGDYIYNISIEVKKGNEKLIDAILETLKFDTIDYAKVGILAVEDWLEDEDGVVSTKKNTTNKFTINIPSTWSSNEDNTSFYDGKKGIAVSIIKSNNLISRQEIQGVVETLKKEDGRTLVKGVTVVPNSNLSSSTLSAYDFEFKNVFDGNTSYVTQTIVSSRKESYILVFVYPEQFYSEATKETVSKILKSFVIE